MNIELISKQCNEPTCFTLDFELITTQKDELKIKINNEEKKIIESDYTCTEQEGYCYIHVYYMFEVNGNFTASLICSDDTSVNQEGIQLFED